MLPPLPPGITVKTCDNRAAVFGEGMVYRYLLRIVWDASKSRLAMLMLNPSKATHLKSDPTVTRQTVRAASMGYGGLSVLNCFSLMATDPDDMKAHPAPVGSYNDALIAQEASECPLVICAWGNDGAHLGRARQVEAILRIVNVPMWALTVTNAGEPGHPLYLPADQPASPYVPTLPAENYSVHEMQAADRILKHVNYLIGSDRLF